MRNVEVKARVKDVNKLIEKAKALSNSDGQLIVQEDTFFHASHGRLKLRVLQDAPSQLVYYERADTDGPKMSNYEIAEITNSTPLKGVLAQSLGIKGEVKKRRLLFLVGQTRIHVDEVEGLGSFMELEVVLTPDQTLQEGQAVAEDLMQKLDTASDDLISGAYMDLLLNK